jgi:hypothetical protein
MVKRASGYRKAPVVVASQGIQPAAAVGQVTPTRMPGKAWRLARRYVANISAALVTQRRPRPAPSRSPAPPTT